MSVAACQEVRLDSNAARRVGHRIRRRSAKLICRVQPILLVLLAYVLCETPPLGGRTGLVQFVCAAVTIAKEDENNQQPSGSRRQIKKVPSSLRGINRNDDDNNSNHPSVPPSSDDLLTFNQILVKAGKRGLGGGLPGAVAGVVQVVTLMWLRTIINYQSRYGASFRQAFSVLLRQGGLPRFYKGLGFALVQAPLSRFVSTAANDGVEALLSSLEATKDWGPGRSTVVASLVVGLWRMTLMPIDTCKTVLQVDSAEGFRNLMRRVRAGRIGVLYQGAIANALSSIVGHYPWFLSYNALSKNKRLIQTIKSQLLRNALIGLSSSVVSDTIVNAIRVVKTTKQAIGSKLSVGYVEVVRMIVAADGWKGLFGRGLRTRIMANALQSIVFTVIWRGLAERWSKPRDGDEQNKSGSESQ